MLFASILTDVAISVIVIIAVERTLISSSAAKFDLKMRLSTAEGQKRREGGRAGAWRRRHSRRHLFRPHRVVPSGGMV